MKRFCAKLLALGLTVSSVLGGIYTALPMSIAYATEVTDNTESGDTATEGNTTTENENQTEAGTVTVEARVSSNKICFTGIDGATGYDVYRSKTSNSQTEGFEKITTETIAPTSGQTDFTYYDTDAGTGTQFWYKIEATKDDGSTVTVGTAQDIYVTGLDAVHKHAQTGQYHRDFVQEGDINFNGSRIEVGKAEDVDKIKEMRDGTILISFMPTTAPTNYRKVLFVLSSEDAMVQGAVAGQANITSTGKAAGLLQESTGYANSYLRLDFGSNFKAPYNGTAPVNEWATFAIVCDVDKTLLDAKTISSYNGTESTRFDNNNVTGFFAHLKDDLTKLSIGGVMHGETPAVLFSGKIAYVTVTDEILTQEEINEYTKTLNDIVTKADTTTLAAPTNVSAKVGDSKVILSWTEVTGNVTKYEVSKDDGMTWEDAGSTTEHTFEGLINDKVYSFQVRAINSFVKGTASDTVTATPKADEVPSVPVAPTDLNATPGDSEVTLTWTAVTEDVTGYEVFCSKDNQWVSAGTETSYTFSELENNTEYTFKVRAVNNDLTGAESDEVTATPKAAVTVPAAPENLVAAPGDTQVVVSWDEVEGATSYEVCVDDGEWEAVENNTSHTFTQLTNDTEYTFKVRAVNEAGEGAEASIKATPTAEEPPAPAVPEAPADVTAIAEDSQITLSWTEVEGATGYQVCIDGGEWETAESNTSHTFTGLNNDQTYTLKVRAVKDDVHGTESQEVTATPTAGENPTPELPATPTGLTTTPSDKQVTLSWTEVEGATSYEVRVDEEEWITVEGGTEYTFTNLTNNQEYTFTVRAINDAGAGTEASTTATPKAEPSVPVTLAAPARFEAQAGDGEVTLSWNEVVGDVTRYEVSMDGGNQWVTADSSTGHTFTGLTNGTEYTFKVRAVNDNGNGAAATTKATPVAQIILPSAPENFTAVAGDGQVTLSWDEVEGDIIRYEVSMNNGIRWVQASSNTNHTFTGLINGRAYTFKVRAISSEGSGEASTTTATPVEEVVPTAPAAPTNVKAQAGDSQVSLSWTEVAGEVIRYEVSSDGGKTWTQANSTTSHTFTGLTNGTEYTFKVRAVNDVGNGAEAAATATPEEPVIPTAPEAPTNFKATPGDRWVKLSWTESEGEVTGYEVSKDGGKTWTKASSKTGHTFARLMNGQEYTFKVRAVNDVGRSPEATATATPQEIVLPDPLTAPENFAAEAGDGEVTLSWKELEGEITRYEVSKDGGRTWVEADSTTGHTFTGLKNGTNYTFKVRGVNDAGNGKEARTTATPKAEVVSPDAPKAPTFSPEPETYKSSINVGIESETKGAVIYYTIDGSKPTNMSKRYTSPITITKTTTIKAIAYKNNVASEIAIGKFEINTSVAVKRVSAPIFSPVAGTYNKDMYIQITTPTEGADIYYTVDGTDPTTDSLKYTGPIWINRRMPFRAIAVKQGMDSSKIVRTPYLMDRKFPFTDIEQNNQWKHECVKYVWDNSIMNGIAGTTLFEPDSPLTRAMFATVLYRMAGEPDVNFAATFSDVEAEKWYSDAIIWANQKGIVQGLGDGSYGINHNITREQIAKMLYEYAKGIGYDISETQELSSFTDESEVSPWAVDYMKWATAVKMITGKPNDDGKTYRMDPKGEATRAECAAMLMRFENKYIPYE